MALSALSALFTRVAAGLRALFRQKRLEQELDDELREYLEMAAGRQMRAGMSREDAMRAARVHMGSLEAVKDRVRDVGWESLVDSIGQDVRFAIRMLRKSPGFAAAAIATLGLGVGGTTAIFSVVDSLFLRAPEGVTDAASLRKLYIRRDVGLVNGLTSWGPGSWADYQAVRGNAPAFAGIGAYLYPSLVDLGRGPEAEQVRVSVVSHDFLQLLGVRPALGRLFLAEEDGAEGAHPVALVSHSTWQARSGRAPDVIGKTLLLNGQLIEIVGVTEKGFAGIEADATEVWLPSSMGGAIHSSSGNTDWRTLMGMYAYYVARLAPGMDDATAAGQAAAALGRAAEAGRVDGRKHEVLTSSLSLAAVPGGTAAGDLSLWLALVAALVLIIACANVANLLLARAVTRRRELAVRLSLGAGMWRIARQHLTESVALLMRTHGEPAERAAAVRSVLQSLRSDLPYMTVTPLTENIRRVVLPFRLGATLFSMFGVLAVVLAAVGLYGVLGYFVIERTPEIGIRLSLGAPVRSVVALVMRQGIVPVGAGLLLGFAVAFAGSRYMASLLFGIDAHDPASFAAAAAFLLSVALPATLLPAWRATRLDPLVALRTD